MSVEQYGPAARLLHRIALGSDLVADMSFELESMLFSRGLEYANQRPVFVAGLARSGSTLLMRLAYATGHFGTLTYRDAPLLLAPNLWGRLNRLGSRRGRLAERAHGDGMLVDFDSPEALEEVFWRVNCGKDYIRSDHLAVMNANAEVVERFRRYVQLILRHSGKPRYLSKNNNNLLRLRVIRKAYVDALILVPFRNPLDQASSLLHQHQRFKRLQAVDPFAREYMRWLVHHEFGADHKPFFWGLRALASQDSDSLDYWLGQWCSTYEFLLMHAAEQDPGLIFVDYDRLCDRPDRTWAALAPHLGIDTLMPPGEPIRRRARPPRTPVNSQSLERAHQIYEQLQKAAPEAEYG